MQTNDFKRNLSLITVGALFAGVFACGMANAQPVMQQQWQTIQVMDPQVGLPALSIAIPQGWTHQFQSTWNKDSDPMVSFSFEAREPGGAGKFFSAPALNFHDIPQLYGQTPFVQKPMPPRQAFEYVLNLTNQNDPKFRAKGYRIIQSKDFPPTEANGGRSSTSTILAEFTENGVQKQEMINVTVGVYGTDWTLSWSGMQDRKGVPQETLATRYVAIAQSFRFLPQWQQRQAAITAQWKEQNYREYGKQLADFNASVAQWGRLSQQIAAQGDAARQANMDSFNRRMESKERVSEMQTDATTGRDNRINPHTGGQFKSDVNVKDVWVSSDGRTISTNDSTYNPNYDSNFSGDWKLAPKGY